MSSVSKADDIHKRKVAFIEKAIKTLGREVAKTQAAFLDLLLKEYLPQFETKDGVIVSSARNDQLMVKLERMFDRLEKALLKDVLSGFARNMITSAELSASYYVAMGFEETVVAGILKNKVSIERKLGFTPTGRLKKDWYLYNLGRTDVARQRIRDFVLSGISGNQDFLDFQLGLRNIVIGNRRELDRKRFVGAGCKRKKQESQ